MKFNISNIKAVFAVAALGAASCTANYEDINRNPYEVTGEEMERDGYAMRSFMTTMQSWVVPTDRNQCQFTDVLLGGPYGGYRRQQRFQHRKVLDLRPAVELVAGVLPRRLYQ